MTAWDPGVIVVGIDGSEQRLPSSGGHGHGRGGRWFDHLRLGGLRRGRLRLRVAARRNGYGPLQVYGIPLSADPAERQPVGKRRLRVYLGPGTARECHHQ